MPTISAQQQRLGYLKQQYPLATAYGEAAVDWPLSLHEDWHPSLRKALAEAELMLRGLRWDAQRAHDEGAKHFNAFQTMLFDTDDAHACRKYANEQTGHHEVLVSLGDAIEAHYLGSRY